MHLVEDALLALGVVVEVRAEILLDGLELDVDVRELLDAVGHAQELPEAARNHEHVDVEVGVLGDLLGDSYEVVRVSELAMIRQMDLVQQGCGLTPETYRARAIRDDGLKDTQVTGMADQFLELGVHGGLTARVLDDHLLAHVNLVVLIASVQEARELRVVVPPGRAVMEDFGAIGASVGALIAQCPLDNGVLVGCISLNADQVFVHTYMLPPKEYVEKIWSRSKARAKAAGIEFTLTRLDIGDMTVPITCPVLGIPIRMERGRQTDNSLSIDRIDSSRGYTPDNVVFVSWKVNRLKSNATLTEMRKMVEFYEGLVEG